MAWMGRLVSGKVSLAHPVIIITKLPLLTKLRLSFDEDQEPGYGLLRGKASAIDHISIRAGCSPLSGAGGYSQAAWGRRGLQFATPGQPAGSAEDTTPLDHLIDPAVHEVVVDEQVSLGGWPHGSGSSWLDPGIMPRRVA
jgi:hypothetical protein